jgi:hypothetical protein
VDLAAGTMPEIRDDEEEFPMITLADKIVYQRLKRSL